MDANTRLFLSALGACLFFAVLGAVFGGLAAVLNRRHGRAAGSFLGLSVAAAFEPLPPLRRAAIVGGIDGLAFGAVVGTLIGLGVGWDGQPPWPRLRSAFACGLALVALATVFGSIAHGLPADERRAVLALSGGGLVGLSIGYAIGAADGLILGALLGLVTGAAIAAWLTSTSST